MSSAGDQDLCRLNNLTRTTVAGRDHVYWYDVNNRLTNVLSGPGGPGVIGLGYDARGNVNNKNGVLFTFDLGNRLRTAAGTETYRYDAQGRRVRTAAPAGMLYEMYSQEGKLLWQRDEQLGLRFQHVYLGGSQIASRRMPIGVSTSSVIYRHTDALGSSIAATDEAGGVSQTTEHEPYGRMLNRVNDNRPGYTGHMMDRATNMIYMQQRYYDPQIGVFLSVDPVTAYSNPIGQFHRYRYANNNPYRFTDPDGRQSVREMIDSGAEGCGPVSCAGWAALNATWQVFGAEGISQIADKGWSNAGAGSRFGAGWEAAAVIPFAKVARTGTVLIGSAQRTTRAGMASGHAFRQLREAATMLRTGGYEKISLHRSLRTLTDGAVNSRLMPDVAGLRPDGKIDITEVLSPGQKAADLQAKYAGALGDRMGDFKAVEATKVMCTGSRIAQTSC